MGMRGPSPQPTALKLLRGNPGKRRLNPDEPKLEVKIPDCPEHLDEVAREEWKRLAPSLVAMKILTDADYIGLGTLCQAYATLIDAQLQLSKSGILYKTKSGYIQQSPLLGIVNSQVQIITSLLREFGLTPSSRTRVVAASSDAPPENKFARLG